MRVAEVGGWLALFAQEDLSAYKLGEAIGRFAAIVLILAVVVYAVQKATRKKVMPPKRRRGRRRLECDHCGALHPLEPVPVRCRRCHEKWSGTEVILEPDEP